MKKAGKFFTLIFTCCLLINTIFLAGCFFEEDPEDSRDISLRNVNMSVEYQDYLEYYSVTINGIADNVSGGNLSYVSLEFNLYDSQGFMIGTASAYTSGILKGESWRFEATSLDFPEIQPTSFKLVEITAW